MITQNLSTLKIHKLTQAQYERELEAGRIDENAIYLTPDEGAEANVQADWNQNDETTADYIKNRTHYEESYSTEHTYQINDLDFDDGSSQMFVTQNSPIPSEVLEANIGEQFTIEAWSQANPSIIITKTLILQAPDYNYRPDYLFTDLETGHVAAVQAVWSSWFAIDPEYFELSNLTSNVNVKVSYVKTVSTIKQLDEKYIPNSIARTNGTVRNATYDSQGNHIADTYAKKSEITDLFTPIDIMAELGAKDVSWNWYDDNWPKTDEDIVNMLTTVTASNQWPDDLFIKLFSLFENYPGILPTFGFFPKESGNGCKYKLTCSTERVEIDSYQETGSTIHPDFNFTYFINLSKDNYLELRFNYDSPYENAIDWDNINLDNLYLTFDLIPKGGNITTEQVAALAQEQIITPALTEEVY